MMLRYFDNLIDIIESKLKTSPGEVPAQKRYALEIARLGKRLYTAGDRVAWCGVAAPFDLLNAMNVTSCFVEFIGAMLASTGMATSFLENAEQSGFGPDICGYHRGVIGAANQGIMPEPDFLIGTTCPCTGGLAIIENLACHFNKELLVLQVPKEINDKNIKYLAAQIEKMVDFVAKKTGEPLDPERLAAAVENTNQTRKIILDVYDMAKTTPSPVHSRDLRNFGVVMALFLGTREGVEVAKAYQKEFSERIANNQSGVKNEAIRLMWIQNRIQFKHPLEKILEEEFQASIVADELNTIDWDPIDPDDPYMGMAQRSMSISLNGAIDGRIDHLQRLASEYKIHGAINPCHWGCRQGAGGRGMIQAGLNKIGVPVLNLEVDCIDMRNFAKGQLTTRIEAFMETIQSNPSPWK